MRGGRAAQGAGFTQGDWPLLLCPQSVFKLHPHFDTVVRRILEATTMQGSSSRPGGAGVDEGARGALEKLGPLQVAVRLRAAADAGRDYYKLLAVADVLLHPSFWGRGRRPTTALGVPVVVRPTTQLRCRMAYLLREHGSTSRNWTSSRHYGDRVAFAAKLANDVEQLGRWPRPSRPGNTSSGRTGASSSAGRGFARVAGQRPVAPADVGLEGQDDEADVGLIEENAAGCRGARAP